MSITSGRREERRAGPAKVMTAADVMATKVKAAQGEAEDLESQLKEFRGQYRQELISYGEWFGEEKKTLEDLPIEELRDRIHELLQTSAVELKKLRKPPPKSKRR